MKIRGSRKSNLEYFSFCNFFQISTDFELLKRFLVKARLTKMCSDRLMETLIANTPDLHFGQEVLLGDLQCLHYHIVDMDKLSPRIQEVIEFQK
jgi:hypothetical protein